MVERLPYKQEVARSSRAPPILTSPLQKRSARKPTQPTRNSEQFCGSILEADALVRYDRTRSLPLIVRHREAIDGEAEDRHLDAVVDGDLRNVVRHATNY